MRAWVEFAAFELDDEAEAEFVVLEFAALLTGFCWTTGATGGVGRVSETTGAGAGCAEFSFEALVTFGVCGASLAAADVVAGDVEVRFGAGADHVLGVAPGAVDRAVVDSSVLPEVGGAVAE